MKKISLAITLIILLFCSCQSKSKHIKELYPNGSVKCEYDTLYGKKVGKYIEYYQTGKIKTECNYFRGLKNGLYKSYFENGNIKTTGIFKSNKESGWFNNNFENGNKFQDGEFIIENKNEPSYLNQVVNYDIEGEIIPNRSFYYKCGIFSTNMKQQNSFKLGDTIIFIIDIKEPFIKDASRELSDINLTNNSSTKLLDIETQNESIIFSKYFLNKKGHNQVKGTFFEISSSKKIFHYYHVLYDIIVR